MAVMLSVCWFGNNVIHALALYSSATVASFLCLCVAVCPWSVQINHTKQVRDGSRHFTERWDRFEHITITSEQSKSLFVGLPLFCFLAAPNLTAVHCMWQNTGQEETVRTTVWAYTCLLSYWMLLDCCSTSGGTPQPSASLSYFLTFTVSGGSLNALPHIGKTFSVQIS